MQSNTAVVTTDPDVQAGTPCFAGTRVPVQCLFDAMTHGRTLDYFIENFPAVTPEQARAVLSLAGRLVGRAAAEVIAAGSAA